MTLFTLVRRSLVHYRAAGVAVLLGVATAVSVLGGALLVGDSVRGSLRDLVLQRLGEADYLVSSAGFFREETAAALVDADFPEACPLLAINGFVRDAAGGRPSSRVLIYGVDDRFWTFHGRADRVGGPEAGEVLVSEALAEALAAAPGDALLVRVQAASGIPAEWLHGRRDDTGRTLRLTVRDVLGPRDLGEFSVRPQQDSVRAVFVSLSRLQRELDREGRANTLLLKGEAPAPRLEARVREVLGPEDLAVRLKPLPERRALSLESERGLLPEALVRAGEDAAQALGFEATPVLSYVANTLRARGREVPYSLVTAMPLDRLGLRRSSVRLQPDSSDPSIVLNDWAARDLGARPGDAVELDFYVWRPDGGLATETASFTLAAVVPLAGAAADQALAPEYPGITDSRSLADWDPPFPIDLRRIRPADEAYWDRHRATPKAFVPLEAGQALWSSRHGRMTSLRVDVPREVDVDAALTGFGARLGAALDPFALGVVVVPVREQGLAASRGATDFGEYFAYFSFFLLVSAVLLAALFFRLGIEQRAREIGLLKASGFPAARLRTLFLAEGAIVAVAGSALGTVGAVAYAWVMIVGLRNWWVDAVGTRLLSLHVAPASLAIGAGAGVLAALVCIVLTLRSLAAASPRSLLAGTHGAGGRPGGPASGRAYAWAAVSAFAGLALLLMGPLGLVPAAGAFFLAGTALLVACLALLAAWLRGGEHRPLTGRGWWPISRLGFRNASHRPGRTVLCAALIASATFIIVAVDAFRRDEGRTSLERSSGTGGYPLVLETVLPLFHDPNTPEGRDALQLDESGRRLPAGVRFARFRLRPGDEASCLNLYRPTDPRILGATPAFVREGRFAFRGALATTGEEAANPWLLLERDEPDGAVPAIADANSMQYVLHAGLGDDIVLHEGTPDEVRLRLVAALADSVLQGELIVAESQFLRRFPDHEGYRFFLIDVPPADAGAVAADLAAALGDAGPDVETTAARLARFHRVENTYLSTFQTLGGLGLLLGTLGLATVMVRNVLERRRELALLRAVGYRRAHVMLLVLAENLLLLLYGLGAGAACALVAILPASLERGGVLPGPSLGALLAAVLFSGILSTLLATAAAWRAPLLPALRAE